MVNFWKLAYETVKKQRDQYKVENDTLINELYTVGLSRDEAGDKIKELERENEKYRIRAENAMELAERANCEVLRLKRENEKLKGDG